MTKITWEEIEAERARNDNDYDYFSVYWKTDSTLTVKIGRGYDSEEYELSPKEAYERFKISEDFVLEFKYLMQSLEEIGYSFEEILNMDPEQLKQMHKKLEGKYVFFKDDGFSRKGR